MPNYTLHTLSCLAVLVVLLLPVRTSAQINYVPNSSFEEVSNCDLEYGDVDKAPPWDIIDPLTSPDLFHDCSTSGFYDLPLESCFSSEVYPKAGIGMIGMATIVHEERVFVRMIDTLPQNIDIYVSFSLLPRGICDESAPTTLCYSNTQCLTFSDFAFQSQIVALQPDGIMDNFSEWTQLETCYRANGTEDLVLIGNYRLSSETLTYCPFVDDQNFSYTFIDEVIVSPFDVVPDTLYLCEGEFLDVDATFYEVPISWSDGWQGAVRTIDRGGSYIVRGRADNCFMIDSTFVVEIPIGTEEIELDICEGEEIVIESVFAGSWENGDTNRVRTIREAGIYKHAIFTPCGERSREYTITTTDCEIRYFVPNAFSPNNDGINDRLQFFFAADFDFTGELNVFDRWGNQLFQAKEVNRQSTISWDGSFRNKDLGAGIYVWTYQYVSARDGETRTISGDVMIVK